jgi:flagellar basal body rod protein FlgF
MPRETIARDEDINGDVNYFTTSGFPIIGGGNVVDADIGIDRRVTSVLSSNSLDNDGYVITSDASGNMTLSGTSAMKLDARRIDNLSYENMRDIHIGEDYYNKVFIELDKEHKIMVEKNGYISFDKDYATITYDKIIGKYKITFPLEKQEMEI